MVSDINQSLAAAQWATLFGLAALVVVMYRQLAYLLQVGRAVAGDGGLEIGERAHEFEYFTPGNNGGSWERRAFAADGRATLLMFTHPGCGSCEVALENFQHVVEQSRTPVRALAVTDAEIDVLDTFDMRPRAPIEIAKVDSRTMKRVYRTYRTPFVYGIGPAGEVRAKGGGVTTRELRRMLRQVMPAQ